MSKLPEYSVYRWCFELPAHFPNGISWSQI